MRLTVRIGPFSVFFTNVNRAMGLAGHSHFATVDLFYTAGKIGFPSFEGTHLAIRDRLRELFSRPFRDHTNEEIARALFVCMDGFTHPEIDRWGGDYRLQRVDLHVRGVLEHARTKIVWLQPLSQSQKATALCCQAAIDNGWRVSFQVHKYAGLR